MMRKMTCFLTLSLLVLSFRLEARNPHHRLRVVMHEEIAKTPSGEALIYRMRPILENSPLLFHCMDLSCMEETRYAYDASEESRVISVNGHFHSAPFPYLGWVLYRAIFRASIFEDLQRQHGVDELPRIRELEYLVAARGAMYLEDREDKFGELTKKHDYYYHEDFDYARQRELSLMASLNAYEEGRTQLQLLVDKRLKRVLGDLPTAEEYIRQTEDEQLVRAARDILNRYRSLY